MKSTLTEALQTQDWFADADQRAVQRRLYEAAIAFGTVSDAIDDDVQQLLVEDLQRRPVGGELDSGTFDGLRELGSLLSETSMSTILRDLPELDWDDPDLAISVMRVRLSFAAKLGMRAESGTSQTPFGVVTPDVLKALRHGSQEGQLVVAAWLATRPAMTDVRMVLRDLTDARAASVGRDALTGWAQEASQEDRTDLAIELLTLAEPRSGAMGAVVDGGSVDELKVVRRADRRIRQLQNGDKRLATSRTLGALALTDAQAVDRVVGLIYWLTGSHRPKTDQSVARALIPALSKAAPAGNQKLRKALERGNKRGLKLNADEGAILQGLEVGLSKSWFGRKVAGWLGL